MPKALQKTANGHTAFQSGQTQASTLVDAKTKGQVFACGALQVELIGLIKLRRVSIGGADAQGHQGTGR